jgi:hypothetical protein
MTLSDYSEERGPLNAPSQWPTYRINKNVSVRTGEKTKQSGIYIPDVDNSCAQFLSTCYDDAPRASVHVGVKDLLHPVTGEKYGEERIFEERDCLWHLVERVTDATQVSPAPSVTTAEHYRLTSGDICPETGYYFTPARPDSRKRFQQGDVMPAFDSAYGTTIWQWDPVQQ